MKNCPKCSTQYGDDLKICRTCGAILEELQAIASDSAPHDADSPHKTVTAKQPSWTCPQCGQSVPGGFEVCWNCGASQDGVPDPGFVKESESDNHSSPQQLPTEATATSIGSLCPKCGSPKIIPNATILDQGHYSDGKLQVLVDADPAALIFKDRLYGQLTADICGDCGHVELKVANPKELYEHYLDSRRIGKA